MSKVNFAQSRDSRRGARWRPWRLARYRSAREPSVSCLARNRACPLPSSRHSRFVLRSDPLHISAFTAARSLIPRRGRVLVGDVIVTGMGGRGGGGEGGATERGWLEYPCLCAKTVALAVKCSYVGHANEGRCVLRYCPKCVEPSAPRRIAFSLLGSFGSYRVPRSPTRNLSNGSALPECTRRAAADRHLIRTLLIFGVMCRRDDSTDGSFFNAARMDFAEVAATRF